MASRTYSRNKKWKKPKTLSERWEGWFPSPNEDDVQPRNRRGRVTGPSKNERLAIQEQEREQAVFDQIQAKKAETESHLKAFETGELTDYDIAKEDLGHIFQRLVENPNMTDQQRTRLIKAGLLVQNSVFDEDTQEASYTYQSGYGNVDFMNKQKDEEFIKEGNQSSVDNTNDTNPSPLQISDNETKIKQTSGGVKDRSAPILNRDERTSTDPQPVEKEKGPDLTIGSSPWSRGSGTSYKDANAATEELLTKEGWDLRGLGIAQKQDLFSDYRTGRLPKTDTSIFFNNQRIKKR
tara:strand:+ start:39 stop:920 length:882 start_codon:yes stop_codon:yes gene_type:complete